ncbi:MAG TPA: class I SAM-dependent methyltransferase [Chthonomonadaceae bacterium]|nr:class I SAM-dependent methyltransferase [Chthonomonadaceae bacterium]
MPDESIEMSKNKAYLLLERWEAALAAGEITEEDWYREMQAIFTPAYLAAETPWGQSGKLGDQAAWEYARSLIADAVDRSGTFLDVGCASGYLMECLARWTQEKGLEVEVYGLDIAPELADLARRRLPHWADRIYVGNAIDWPPRMRFDFVRTGLEYVPQRRQPDFVARLLRDVVAPGGRLFLGTYGEERDELLTAPSLEAQLAGWGFPISGRTERPNHRDPRLFYRVVWIDLPDPTRRYADSLP